MNKNTLMLVWIGLLSFIAGYVNVYGIITIGLTLTHFTGDLSKSAIVMVEHSDVGYLFKVLEGLLLYVAGNIFAGALIGERTFNPRKRYGIVYMCIGLALLIAYFGFADKSICSYILCLTIGIQNGLFITYKGILIRTSHITGSISDFGVYLGYKLRGIKTDNWKLCFYLTTIMFFFMGSFMSKMFYDVYEKQSILLVPFLYFIVGGYYLRHREDFKKTNRSVE